jgi:hypothetical protein
MELKNWDSFSENIFINELTRASNGGVYGVLAGGTAISLPPLLNFGSDYLKDKYVK